MKLVYLSQTSSNKSKIGEFSDRLGTDGLSLYGRNHWATGDLQVNSYSGEGGLISFPFFLVEGNAILPMTPRAGCAVYCHYYLCSVDVLYPMHYAKKYELIF